MVVKQRESIAMGGVGCFSSATLLFNYVINKVLYHFLIGGHEGICLHLGRTKIIIRLEWLSSRPNSNVLS